jgi:DNA-binding LytR/AlgR family response regulator
MTLRILAVDDERPALDELVFLLQRDPRVGTVHTASDGAGALRLLQETVVDAVFLDIRMPGLTGLDLARVLSRFRQAPVVVFVSAYDDHAVDAFEVKAVDYVMKPVRETRLREAVRRAIEARRSVAAPETDESSDETIPVELGGVTRFIQRSDIRYAEAQGDYARLHTAEGSHLVRVPLSTLEERWTPEGFVRIHRSHLVSIGHIVEIRTESGRCTVEVAGGDVLQVSRRHTRELRDRLIRQVRPGAGGASTTEATGSSSTTDNRG